MKKNCGIEQGSIAERVLSMGLALASLQLYLRFSLKTAPNSILGMFYICRRRVCLCVTKAASYASDNIIFDFFDSRKTGGTTMILTLWPHADAKALF